MVNYPSYVKKTILPSTITGLAPGVEKNSLKMVKPKEENRDLSVYPAGIPFLLEKNKKRNYALKLLRYG
ncbi:hypothetical protein COZ39_02860 [Candidatus Roizmanbacteria bacterium CG_4_10_14_3_um_filter_33_21]|uniref:Uncharacterized protein n=1 Tax=Candidatus Roizmanbacteria bacterium CG_4_10_14_3_um_filter_33_21 TaxID=1974830 RepID=A0A2M7LWQ6_9BACT|nr:MAG: hypothetical protein COZ39_02860 [Candidatus Roizmanbacteria bacterium CG_4_10_14_3_um_filter_33_21]